MVHHPYFLVYEVNTRIDNIADFSNLTLPSKNAVEAELFANLNVNDFILVCLAYATDINLLYLN